MVRKLFRKSRKNGHPLAYISKALKGRALALSTYEKEMLSILLAIQKWRQYLLGRRFIIRTDQRSLKFLLDQRFRQEPQHPWLLKLTGCDYMVEYKKGTENRIVDALSRREEEVEEESKSSFVRGVSVVEPSWLIEVKAMALLSTSRSYRPKRTEEHYHLIYIGRLKGFGFIKGGSY